MKWDLHVHTRHSFDSFARPEAILRRSKRRGLDGIAITDHNGIRGALETRAIRAPEDPAVVVGEEVSTDAGDLIGLFLGEPVEPGPADRVADRIRGQGGLVVLPHPYRGHIVTDELLRLVDIVEASNARTSARTNMRAAGLCQRAGKPGIAVSDAHFSFHVGAAWIETEEEDLRAALLHARFTTRPGYTRPSMTALSQMIKSVRLGGVSGIPGQAAQMAIALVRTCESPERTDP